MTDRPTPDQSLLTPGVLEACAAIVDEIDPDLDPEDLTEVLEEWREEHAVNLAGLALGGLGQAFAVRIGGAGTNLLLPLGEWTGEGTDLAGSVLVVPVGGAPEVTTWEGLRDDPGGRWWIRPGDAITGGRTEDGRPLPVADGIEPFIPFSFDGVEWSNTFQDAESDSGFHWGGVDSPFALEEVQRRYATTVKSPATDGIWLELEGGWGERGHDFVVSDGELWHSQWGIGETFIGPVESTDIIAEIIEVYGGPDSSPASPLERLESEVLDATAFRPLFDAIVDLDDNFDPENCAVSCTDFDGTADEYLAATGGGSTPKP
ncbi:MAG: hypothetical protein ACKOBG_12165 [Actinomycetota bacterium]